MKAAITLLVFCVTGLLSLGMVMLYSSGMAKEGAHYLVMQLAWGGLGLVACIVAAIVDYRILKKFAWALFALALVLVALLFVPPFGIHKNGATRWLGYGRTSLLQPSEFAKLALLIGLAWYGDRYQRQMPTWKRGILVPGIFVGLLLGLIFIEPDRGTTVLLAGVSLVMLLVAGVRWKYIVPPAMAALMALGLSLWHDPMRSKRIFSWLYLEESKSGVGYQAYQAMLALGAGGWTGLGLGNGRQKLGFVPEHHTDFIFSIIGEELGLLATLLVVLGFVLIIACGIYISIHARDTFGLLLGTGITFLVGLQAFINIGVVTSALPNKGLPLPFVSYGGSNLMIMLTAIGILLSIARQARLPETMKAGAAEGDPA
jgi:cell division protein FtsW